MHFINSFLAQFSIGDRLLAIISNVNVNLGLAATLRVRAEVVPVASRRLLSLTDATIPLSALLPPLSSCLSVCLPFAVFAKLHLMRVATCAMLYQHRLAIFE